LGTLFIFMASIGLVISYTLGAFMRYDHCVWVFMILPLLYLMTTVFFPETPSYLVKKKKFEVKFFLVFSLSKP
jgi:uncharacterized membrane protein